MDISNTRSNYIILSNNIINSNNVGTNIYIKTKVIDLSNSNDDLLWHTSLNRLSNNYKNRIILSGKVNTDTLYNTPCCLITKNNIKNNMKFIFDSSNNVNGKILFVKNLNISDNSYNYLFNSLKTTFLENDISYNINNSYNNTISYYNQYIYHLNYYFSNNFDIYKLNMRDYLYKYINVIRNNNILNTSVNEDEDISYNRIFYSINNVVNDFSFINTTIDSSSIINFKSSNYSSLLIDNSTYFTTSNNSNITTLDTNIKYSIYRNILSYNKYTLDFKHVNYYDISIFYNTTPTIINFFSISLPNNIIKTFLIKTNNLNILKNIKSTSKIVFGFKNIYLNNIKVLDKNSNFYNKIINFNFNNSSKKLIDASNLMFISLTNKSIGMTGLTGITQHDIYNHTHFVFNTNNNLTIKIKKNINTANIINNSKFTSLIPSLSNYYLLDIPLNYTNNNNINNSYNINNTINYNNILYNSVTLSTSKVFNLDFNSYFDAKTNNYFKNSFNNLAILNNISNPIYSISSELVNASINIKFVTINKPENIKLKNRAQLFRDLVPKNSEDGYDLRYNYNLYFEISNTLNIVLDLSSLNLRINFFLDYYVYDYSLLNFYSLTSSNLIKTTAGSDFTNVDCVYIYHDPITEENPLFKYPYDNIERKFDTEIDSLASAIEQYRGTGARTSTTNAAFIPAKNGSNLSRKMIQGIIGLNDVPKLLSIKPYDPNSIIGRGFINQYQIDDTCITSNCDKIEVKQNAIKHDSVKNNKMFASNSLKKQNYANIVRSNVRNKFSQDCINNSVIKNNVVTINNTTNPLDPNCNNIKKYTPMLMYRKGKYL